MQIGVHHVGGLAGPKIIRGFGRAFAKLGHQVYEMSVFLQTGQPIPKLDVIMGYDGAGCIALEDKTLLHERLGCQLVQYWADDYEELHAIIRKGLIYQSDRGCNQKWRDAGIDVSYLPLATDPDVFTILPAEKAFNVVISGVPSPPRLAVLERLKEFQPAVFGFPKLWNQYPEWLPYYKGCVLEETELNKLYNLTRILVDHSSPQNLDSANFTVFNGLASGCVLVTNYKPALEELFSPQDGLFVYETLDDLYGIVKALLKLSDRALMELATIQRKAILNRHTFVERAKVILQDLERAKT